MNKELLDIYTDYLICQNKYATATGLSDLLSGEISHDKITRFLHSGDFGSKELWRYVKPTVHKLARDDGVLILDDSIEEKPYTDENEVNCWHYAHAKGRTLKGINILSCMVRYGDVSLPIGYEVIRKSILYSKLDTRRVHRKSEVTKNELFRNLITQAVKNGVTFKHILADNWFGSSENLEFIDKADKYFIIGIKSNRNISFSQNGPFLGLKQHNLEKDHIYRVWLKGLAFPVSLLKKVFTNEDGSEGILYLVSNDFSSSADQLYSLYQKRWSIEEYHKSIKQNASLAKSPTKRVRSQCNHIFSSLVSYCKLELLKIKTSLNHFALKYKLILRANQVAMQELQIMRR